MTNTGLTDDNARIKAIKKKDEVDMKIDHKNSKAMDKALQRMTKTGTKKSKKILELEKVPPKNKVLAKYPNNQLQSSLL